MVWRGVACVQNARSPVRVLRLLGPCTFFSSSSSRTAIPSTPPPDHPRQAASKTSPMRSLSLLSPRSYDYTSACMDQRLPERKAKRAREEEANDHAAPRDFPFEVDAALAGTESGAGDVVGEASRRPPGVFQLPWQKCRGGLGLAVSASSSSSSWELRDVFFRSLVDGGAAAIGVPGDRLVSPPQHRHSRRALLDGVDAWLAAAADGGEEVDPVWRSALMDMDGHGHGPSPRPRPRMLRG